MRRRPPRDRRGPPAARRGASASARLEVAADRPKLEKRARGGDRRGEGRPRRLREGARAAGWPSWRRQKAEKTATLARPTSKAYEATARRPGWPPGKSSSGRRRRAGCRSTPKALRATDEADADAGARPLDRRRPARTSKATYTVVAETDLTRHHRHPAGGPGRRPTARPAGPGRAPDGNFVLTEFEVTAASEGRPEGRRKPSRSRTPRPTSARRTSTSQPPSTATEQRRQGLGRLAGHRRDPLGDLRDEGADRLRGRHGPDLHAAPDVPRQRLHARAGSGSR